MLGMTVFQFVIADTLPETSRTKQPLLSAFLLINLVVVGVAVFLILVTVTIHSSRYKIKNNRVRSFIVNTMPSLLCVNTDALTNGISYTSRIGTEKATSIDDAVPRDGKNVPVHQLENNVINNETNETPFKNKTLFKRVLSQKEERKQMRNSSVTGEPVSLFEFYCMKLFLTINLI